MESFLDRQMRMNGYQVEGEAGFFKGMVSSLGRWCVEKVKDWEVSGRDYSDVRTKNEDRIKKLVKARQVRWLKEHPGAICVLKDEDTTPGQAPLSRWSKMVTQGQISDLVNTKDWLMRLKGIIARVRTTVQDENIKTESVYVILRERPDTPPQAYRAYLQDTPSRVGRTDSAMRLCLKYGDEVWAYSDKGYRIGRYLSDGEWVFDRIKNYTSYEPTDIIGCVITVSVSASTNTIGEEEDE